MEDNTELQGIAVIGMAGRFPKANSIAEYWHNLKNGIDCASELTDEEILASGVPEDVINNPDYVKRGYLLNDIAGFDAPFFDYVPREAELLDPQARIFLECAQTALDDAGYDPDRFHGAIGVYAGSGINNYLLKNILTNPDIYERVLDFQAIISNDKDYLATRVNYKLNLTGPGIVVQTACSTSLVAVQLACQSLLTYQCDIALAGGVSLQTPRAKGYLYKEGEIFAPDGICRAFDKDATGTILGEGAGIVVLKRLDEAIEDHDHIRAVIRGAAINNDGSMRIGYTAPSVKGQSEVITMAHTLADVDAEDITYIEAHGTGTGLGDPIEVNALTRAFRMSTEKKNYCAIGSVKTMIGHLDVAAGIAGLIKTILALEYKKIPPTLNFTEPNPDLHIEQTPFFVADKLTEWNTNGKPRIAGVSSFGIGGTNAHVIVQEAPKIHTQESLIPWHILPISAKSKNALTNSTEQLADYFKHHPDISIADVAHTLQTGRRQFSHRRIAVCKDSPHAAEILKSLDASLCGSGTSDGSRKSIAFMFSGQGTQYANMCRGLYESEPVFKNIIDTCASAISDIVDFDLLTSLFMDPENQQEALKINQTSVAQPALYAVECGLAELWKQYGIQPEMLIGHSIGEFSAAYESGVFSLEEGARIVAARGKFMQQMTPGTMMAIPLPEDEVKKYINGKVEIAVVNGPSITVVSGSKEAIADFDKMLQEKGIQGRHLHTSHAFHSKMMDAAVAPFVEEIKKYTLQEPTIPFISNVTGNWITAAQATDPQYWANHLRSTVRFAAGLETLCADKNIILLEVGPGNTLTSISRQQSDRVRSMPAIPSARHPRQKCNDAAYFMRAYGLLWTNGGDVDLAKIYQDEQRSKVMLPTYPFEHKQYWIEPKFDRKKKLNEKQQTSKFSFFKKKTILKDPHKEQKQSTENAEETLTKIWKELLGIDTVKPEDNFFDIGGHSLMAAQLFAKIKEYTGKNLPLSTLIQAPTIKQLSEIIKAGESDTGWSSLVPIEKKGNRPPLFLIHGAEGNILLYRELTRHLQPDQPIFGFQCKGLDGKEEPYTTIEPMARDYVEDLLKHSPEGPYYLGGYCLGGMVAFEMAQQLQQKGHEVAFLGMIESYSYRGCGVTITPALEFFHKLQNIVFHANNMIHTKKGGLAAFIKNKAETGLSRLQTTAKTSFSSLGRKFKLTQTEELSHLKLSPINDRAYYDYFPKKYTGPITVFRPKRHFSGYNFDDCGWGVLTDKKVDVHVIQADPRGMLNQPFVEQLASEIRAAMDTIISSKPQP